MAQSNVPFMDWRNDLVKAADWIRSKDDAPKKNEPLLTDYPAYNKAEKISIAQELGKGKLGQGKKKAKKKPVKKKAAKRM